MPKILLVEDNEENREGLARRLLRRGYQVLMAADGQQGVTMARLEKPDLILLDMNMPVLDGWRVARKLREMPETRQLPVIALTAHAMSGDRDRTLEAGCNDYHTKPVDLPRLLEQIETLLKK